MRARIGLGVAMLGASALVAGAAAAAEAEMSAGDCFVAAMKASDADAVSMCYAPDAIIWFPGGPMAKGREAIRDGFAGFLANATVRDARLDPIGGEAVGDARVAWGTYAITLEDKATHAVTVERGRYTDVQKKIDGRWQYIVDHPSDEPPAPAQ
ncbi:MAG TPA: nuclear transport factor 2 family protein [Luteimonas sp.]|nr:nuclear transport factor 2 family protein [Luteimonas sp.]